MPVATQLWGPSVKHKAAHPTIALSQGSEIRARSDPAARSITASRTYPQHNPTSLWQRWQANVCFFSMMYILNQELAKLAKLQSAFRQLITLSNELSNEEFFIILNLFLAYARLAFRLLRRTFTCKGTSQFTHSQSISQFQESLPVATVSCTAQQSCYPLSFAGTSIFISNCNINLSRLQLKAPPLEIKAEITNDKNRYSG